MKFLRFTWCLGLSFAASTCFAQSNPVPFVNQPVVPAAVAPSGPGFVLTVNGAGFVSGSVVNWNGTPLATTFVKTGELTAVVPATIVSKAGTASVTVVSPSPGGGSSNPVPFTIIEPTSNLVFRDLPVAETTAPLALAAADFNHDGIADLAVIDQGPAPSCNYEFSSGGSVAIANGCHIEHGRIVDVALPRSWFARFQVVEYMRSFLLFRLACASQNAVVIISGAFGLFRRDAMIAVGGYDRTAIGEDMDLTIRLQRYFRARREPVRIAFDPNPLAWTQAPEDWRDSGTGSVIDAHEGPPYSSSDSEASAGSGSRSSADVAAAANSVPPAPPRRKSSIVSVTSCRTRRPRVAPNAARTLISRRRAIARAARSDETFAPAMSMTSTDAPSSRTPNRSTGCDPNSGRR